MNRYTSFAVFLYSAISLIFPSGYSVGAGLLVAGGLLTVLQRRNVVLSQDDKRLMAVFVFYFLVSVGMNWLHGEIIKEYDLPMRFLLALPALMLLRAYPPTPTLFWAGLAVGGILAGVFAGWQSLTTDNIRAAGYTNPIQYGNISSIIGILCLVGLGWARSQKRQAFWIVLLLCGFMMGMLGSMFTGSRGSWAGFPFSLIILCYSYGGELNRRHVFGGMVAVMVVVTIAYVIPRTELKARTELAVTEGLSYLKTRNTSTAGTSIGTRMEMWRAGAMAIEERPWLGWGKGGFVTWESAAIKAGRVDPLMENNNHVYNEWLDAMVKRGVLGLLVLLALYVVPMRMFIGRLKQGSQHVKPYAIGGILLFVNYIAFGFSQVSLAHNTGVMTLAFTTVILWSLLRAEEDRHTQA